MRFNAELNQRFFQPRAGINKSLMLYLEFILTGFTGTTAHYLDLDVLAVGEVPKALHGRSAFGMTDEFGELGALW